MFTLEIINQILRTKPIASRNLDFIKSNPKAKLNNAGKEKCKNVLVKSQIGMFQIITKIFMHR